LATITGVQRRGSEALTGLEQLESHGGGHGPARTWAPVSPAPRHCGTAMEWKAPPTAGMSVHTFGTGDEPAALPPLWRCRCGFQLDGVVRASKSLTHLAWKSR
jgi:hypothetical protein